MKRKFIAITIFILFFVSLLNPGPISAYVKKNDNVTEKVTVYLNSFNTKNIESTSSVELSYSQAEQIKYRFLEIEKNFQGIDKINKQIQILKDIDILPSDFSVDILLSILDDYDTSSLSKSSIPLLKLTMGGPLIVSHLTIGGRIKCLFSLKPLFYNSTNIPFNGILNGSYINKVIGILPMYIGAVFKPVFVTAIGPKIIKSSKHCLFPFFEILVPCIGTSIAFVYVTKNSRPITLFEYNLDVCLFGLFIGI